jgi:hypothetical protein
MSSEPPLGWIGCYHSQFYDGVPNCAAANQQQSSTLAGLDGLVLLLLLAAGRPALKKEGADPAIFTLLSPPSGKKRRR